MPILINHAFQSSPPYHPKGHGFKPLNNIPKNIQWIHVPIPAHVGKSVNIPRHWKCLNSSEQVQRAWLTLSNIKESFRSVRNVNKLLVLDPHSKIKLSRKIFLLEKPLLMIITNAILNPYFVIFNLAGKIVFQECYCNPIIYILVTDTKRVLKRYIKWSSGTFPKTECSFNNHLFKMQQFAPFSVTFVFLKKKK